MTPEPNEHSPPGWYDDPALLAARRYWDGTNWTAQTAPRQPSPVAPGPTPAGSAPPVTLSQPAPMARKEAPQRLSPFSIAWRAIIRAIIMGALCASLLGFFVLLVWLLNTESRVRFRYVLFAPVTLIASVVVGVFANMSAGVPDVPAVLVMLVLTYALLTCIVAVFESRLPPHMPSA